MKLSNKCPKCDSEDLIRIPGQVGAHGSGNNISVGFTTFSSIKVTRYLCSQCGFTEEWIDSKGDIDKLANKYSRY